MTSFRMLEINLTTGSSTTTDISALFAEYLGGTGVATRLLLDSPSDIDPYAPEAPIYFAIGPFSSVLPVATKTVALFKSPLTGNLGESHAGGRLALAMYGAGIHVLKITGACTELSYLVIHDDKITIRRATSLKNMSALATERVLREREDSQSKRSIVRIGPAGERRSPMAAVTVDGSRHFGRMGLGGVMGSKNLKAFVISGSHYWTIENKAKYNALYKKLYDVVVKSETMHKYHDLGTAMNVVPLNQINGLPTRNFSQGYFESAHQISGETFADKHLAQQTACAHCPTGCIHIATLRECFDVDDHHFKTFKVSYDHELIYALGSNLSIQNAEDILKLLLIIEKQGWDAISMGVTLAWACEAFQHGLITPKHTDGLIFNFGDAFGLEKAMQHIAAGKNEFFRDLERGASYCAAKYGGTEFAVAFGKTEAAGYATGPFAFLGYATGTRHSHLDSAGYSIDQKAISKPKPDEDLVKDMYKEAVWRMIPASLVICFFARNVYTKEVIVEGLDALGIPGWNDTRLDALAKRIHAMKFRYKLNCGFRWEDLTFPKRLEQLTTSMGQVTCMRFGENIARFRQIVETDLQQLSL
ncbi:MAG TPA: aldehyde ferredoxin oxidoreductase N-terminal domain-containing protein [Candidatus Ozemobacteraceae bacterium]|nr:aldehyde ferredoxin oxidoreductase N-terminal domain-containing protein [Candidatus Ozemobacteraceae bacterium]